MSLFSRKRQRLVRRIRALLASRDLTLSDIARLSVTRFPDNPLFHVAPTFYDSVRHLSFTPSAQQLYALSVLTRYRLSDWLALFGLNLDKAGRFQVSEARHYTNELDSQIYEPNVQVQWFEENHRLPLGNDLTPLTRWLTHRVPRTLDSLAERHPARFRYLRIGSRDAYAFPDLLPGSIVRVTADIPPRPVLSEDKDERILAIEYPGGVLCSRVRFLEHDRIVLCSGQLPYPPVELVLGSDAKIFGYVDLELRRLESKEAPEVRSRWTLLRASGAGQLPARSQRLGEYLRQARLRSGFSLREASERTRRVAHALGHPVYFCAPGTLSDLEAQNTLPRHIQKWISLSAVYCVPVGELAIRAGLQLEQAGQNPFPPEDESAVFGETELLPLHRSPFLLDLEQHMGDLPLFLHHVLADITGLRHFSVRDLFWAGSTQNLVHPYLRGSLLLAVNRKRKFPVPSLSAPVWAQPLYVLELRNGRRFCAACTLEGNTLIVRPCTAPADEILRLHHPTDVEIVGRVVALARRL